MKITKDILKILKIENIYIVKDETLYVGIPYEINDIKWIMFCDSDTLEGIIQLKIKYHDSYIYFESTITKIEQEENCSFMYELNIKETEKNKDEFKKAFFEELNKMEAQAEIWNQRKEERYEIGLDEGKIRIIGFKDAEQKVITDKLQLPCIINNISYSGAKITTLESSFQKNSKIGLCLSFTNPIEQIPLIAEIRNCCLKTGKDKTIFAILSLQFEETVIEYKQRIDNYIKKINEE